MSKFLVKADKALDFVPILSTLTNTIDIFQKCAVFPLCKKQCIEKNRYFTHLKNKKLFKCVLLLIPIFGNIVIGIITVNKKVQKSRENKKKEIQDIFHINQANFEQIQKNGDIRPIQVNQIPKESPEQKAIVILNKTDPTKESVIKDVVLNGLSLNQNKDVLVFVDEAFHEEIEAEPKGLPHIPAPIVPAINPEKERVLKNLEVNGLALQYVNDKFKDDKDVIKKAVAACGYALEYASKRLQNDKELVLLAVARDGRALQYASLELKEDKDIALTAVKQDGFAYICVGLS